MQAARALALLVALGSLLTIFGVCLFVLGVALPFDEVAEGPRTGTRVVVAALALASGVGVAWTARWGWRSRHRAAT
jgi:membrane-bound ClpP family serine protease